MLSCRTYKVLSDPERYVAYFTFKTASDAYKAAIYLNDIGFPAVLPFEPGDPCHKRENAVELEYGPDDLECFYSIDSLVTKLKEIFPESKTTDNMKDNSDEDYFQEYDDYE